MDKTKQHAFCLYAPHLAIIETPVGRLQLNYGNLANILLGTFDGKYSLKDCKLILRPLSDMTESEAKELCDILNKFAPHNNAPYEAGKIQRLFDTTENPDTYYMLFCESLAATDYLLSRDFDLYNLIEQGIAKAKEAA